MEDGADKKQTKKEETPAPVDEEEVHITKYGRPAAVYQPGQFEAEHHFYIKVLNAQIHPLVAHFFRLGNKRIVSRYCHLYPNVNAATLTKLLEYKPEIFRWAGADLFNVTEAHGGRKMVVVETNSCPSGQKSMPLLNEEEEAGGYRILMERTFKPYILEQEKRGLLPEGGLAVVYDKNKMEASGYAAVLADTFSEEVYLVEYYERDENPAVRWTKDWIMEVKTKDGVWHPIRAAFRYVTQKPWNRFPVVSRGTLLINPVVACLAGGRNKLVAAKAYEFFNSQYEKDGLVIRTPETIRDVSAAEIPLYVQKFGGHAVVKIPYLNAGQGVYTITSKEELQALMKDLERNDYPYKQFIVQSLVGNSSWSSTTHEGQYFHVGTIPDKNDNIYAVDIRMMVHYDFTKHAFRPIAVYSRRARKPLKPQLVAGEDSWACLGTNLSVKQSADGWSTETNRLLLMDTRDFNRLGVGTDDLIDAYIQSVLASVAIDKLAKKLLSHTDENPLLNDFNMDLFRSLVKDDGLVEEVEAGQLVNQQ
ncbi:Alpha-L-glutamate ligase [Balamuthia mandrillaris]